VYLVTLSKDTENPLGPRSDEVGKKKDKDKDKEKADDKGKDAAKTRPGPTRSRATMRRRTIRKDKDKNQGQRSLLPSSRPGRIHDRPGRARFISFANYTNRASLATGFSISAALSPMIKPDDDSGPDSRAGQPFAPTASKIAKNRVWAM